MPFPLLMQRLCLLPISPFMLRLQKNAVTTILSAPKLLSFFPPTATTSMMSEGIEYVHRYDVHEGLSSSITATRP